MKINKLMFKNFRQYKEFEFKIQNDNTVIVADNGVGKSTLRSGILIGFYGIGFIKELFEDIARDSEITKLICKNSSLDESCDVEIKIDFTISKDNDEIKHYNLTRKINFIAQPGSKAGNLKEPEQYYMYNKANMQNELTLIERKASKSKKIEIDEPQKFIENLIPSSFSKMFIFHGEGAVALSKNSVLQTGITQLSGLEKVDRAIKIMKTLEKEIKSSGVKSEKTKNLENIIEKKEQKNNEIKTNVEEIKKYAIKVDEINSENQELEKKIRSNENAEKKKDTEKQFQEILDSNINLRRNVYEIIFDDMISIESLNRPLQRHIEIADEKIKERNINIIEGVNVSAIEYIQDKGICICGTQVDEIMNRKLTELSPLLPPNSVAYYNQVMKNFRTTYVDELDDRVSEYSDLDDKIQNTKDKIEEIKNETKNIEDVREFQIKLDNNTEEMLNLKAKSKILEIQVNDKREELLELNKQYEKAVNDLSDFEIEEKKLVTIKNVENILKETKDEIKRDFAAKIKEKTKLELSDTKVNLELNYKNSKDSYVPYIAEYSDGEKVIINFSLVMAIIASAREIIEQNEKYSIDYRLEFPLVLDGAFSNLGNTYVDKLCDMIFNRNNLQKLIVTLDKDFEHIKEYVNSAEIDVKSLVMDENNNVIWGENAI